MARDWISEFGAQGRENLAFVAGIGEDSRESGLARPGPQSIGRGVGHGPGHDACLLGFYAEDLKQCPLFAPPVSRFVAPLTEQLLHAPPHAVSQALPIALNPPDENPARDAAAFLGDMGGVHEVQAPRSEDRIHCAILERPSIVAIGAHQIGIGASCTEHVQHGRGPIEALVGHLRSESRADLPGPTTPLDDPTATHDGRDVHSDRLADGNTEAHPRVVIGGLFVERRGVHGRDSMRGYLSYVIRDLLHDLRNALAGSGFDARIVGKNVIDTGPQAARAMAIARRLNTVRKRRPKQPVVLWSNNFSALTLRGKWVYVSKALAERLSDDGLAFVLAHEMAHHDLDHLTTHMAMAGMLGWKQDMEGHADRRAFETMVAAGFDPQGALDVTHRDLWEDEPEDDLSHWPEGLRDWAQRHRRSHPLMSERHEAVKRWIAGM